MRSSYLLSLITFLLISSSIKSQVFQIDTTIQPYELINSYFVNKNHNGIIIRNIKYSGLSYTKGIFYYNSKQNILPNKGIVLSTGNAIDALGPNNKTASTENFLLGDKDLKELANYSKTYDAVICEFDFISFTDSIDFVFQFASEEYPEYINKGVSDVFGFFITNIKSNLTTNLAKLPTTGDPITIDFINGKKNQDYYIPNNKVELENSEDLFFFENQLLFQFDGFTKPINTGMKLIPFVPYHFKIALADVGDHKFDSWIFLKGNSFLSLGNKTKLTYNNIVSYLEFKELDDIIIEENDKSVDILLPIHFDYNSYSIPESSNLYLEKLLDLFKHTNNQIVIKGFTDESGTTEYNQELSLNRAAQIKEYYISKGISSSRIKCFGKGELKNGVLNKNSRKVEFNLIKKAVPKEQL